MPSVAAQSICTHSHNTYIHSYTHIHIYICTHRHTNSLSHTHTDKHTHIHAHIQTHTCVHTHTHTLEGPGRGIESAENSRMPPIGVLGQSPAPPGPQPSLPRLCQYPRLPVGGLPLPPAPQRCDQTPPPPHLCLAPFSLRS